ncbi:MAG: tyrosine--tRNA ligase [Caedimonas sp.]|nr:tyrosine--tRNA ligase [Caedimonas sp.]
MFNPKSDFLRETLERGFFHQATDLESLDNQLLKGPVIAYLGFDATAKSLHVGNLVQIMRLRLLQRTGHKPIVLMGGGTTRVGDPSGKDEMRKVLSDEEIHTNLASMKQIFARYLKFGTGPTDALMINNAEWLNDLNYLDFLRNYGRHFSINRMMTFDSVRLRLERKQSLSFLEFNYMILQAYDFLELKRRYGVTLQLGGADQWGNIVSGVDLVRRTERKESFGLTSPLITTASGAKMGKTVQGAVWLNAQQLPIFDFWQFWRNTHDADVGKFLRMFTDLPLEEIIKLEMLQGQELNDAKKILADEVTRLCHGEHAVSESRKTAESLFERHTPSSVEGVSLPIFDIDPETAKSGLGLLELFKSTGLVPSNGEARRLIRGYGARLNDEIITDESRKVTLEEFGDTGHIKLSAGKKRHILLKLKK